MLRFESSTFIQAPLESVWAFHERDDIFDLLNPPDAKVKVILRKGKLQTGSRVEFRVPIGPLRFRWLALHVDHELNHHFTDEQIAGPFRYWKHEHVFEPENGGTRLTDRITFSLPTGMLADWLFGWAVKLKLAGMFRYRHKVTKEYCEAGARQSVP